MMAEAEQEAAKWTASVLEQAQLDCEEKKKQEARGRLEQAVAFLVEKVVKKLDGDYQNEAAASAGAAERPGGAAAHLQRMGCVGDQRAGRGGRPFRRTPGDWEGLTAVLELRTPDGSAPDPGAGGEAVSGGGRCPCCPAAGAKGRGMLTPRPQLTEEELFEPAACAAGTRRWRRCSRRTEEAALLQAEQGKLTAQKAALAPGCPWTSLWRAAPPVRCWCSSVL